jgi:hypothetical protein
MRKPGIPLAELALSICFKDSKAALVNPPTFFERNRQYWRGVFGNFNRLRGLDRKTDSSE